MKPTLLIVELWGLGDLAIATPFLRKACGQFDVTLLAKPFASDLQPRFWPEVKVVPFNAPWTAFAVRQKYRVFSWPWSRMFSVWKTLRREKFDLALSARWDPRDHFLLSLTGARSRLGFPRTGSRMFLTHPLASPQAAAHRYENWLAIARALNVDLESRKQLSFPHRSKSETVLVHTGAAQPVRVWPLDRYQRVVEQLRARGRTVQVLCNPDQLKWWNDVGEKQAAAPQSVSELLRFMEGAGVFIGNDSGPGHLAAVSGIPTFTLFGPQVVEWFVPLHPEAEFIQGKACPYKPCFDYCRFPVPHCLWDISLEETLPKVEKFVARHLDRNVRMGERREVQTLT